MPYCASYEQLSQTGVAVPLLFDFAAFGMTVALVTTVIYSIYTMILYARENDCKKRQTLGLPNTCGPSWIFFLSAGNYPPEKYDTIERILFVVNFAVLNLLLTYFLYRAHKIDEKLDSQNDTPSDYSIEVEDIPREATVADIKSFFEQIMVPRDLRNTDGPAENAVVVKVTLGSDIRYLAKYTQEKLAKLK